jgi:hypothetical protein
MPVLIGPVLSLRDIQGRWCERDCEAVWCVDGILAESSKMKVQSRRQQRKFSKIKPTVLSDGPKGVVWGDGCLTGNLENGWLVWRNRRGEATYFWKKVERKQSKQKAPHTEPMTAAGTAKLTPPIGSIPQVPTKAELQNKIEKLSPRSTNSATSNETAEMTEGMASLLMNASGVTEDPNNTAAAEKKVLFEMAATRLLGGDVYLSMQLIALANSVQPLINSASYSQQWR